MAALADPTRRGVLEQFGRADVSVFRPRRESRYDAHGHEEPCRVLEQAGLVTTENIGRVRRCRRGPRRLEEETAWLEKYRQGRDARFDKPDKVVAEMKRKEKGKNAGIESNERRRKSHASTEPIC